MTNAWRASGPAHPPSTCCTEAAPCTYPARRTGWDVEKPSVSGHLPRAELRGAGRGLLDMPRACPDLRWRSQGPARDS